MRLGETDSAVRSSCANVDTRSCAEPEGLAYTLAHLHELVVKPVAESGGYGLLIGPHASKIELE